MARPMWFVELIKWSYPARFFLSKLTRKSTFFRRLIDHLMFEGDEIYYLPKDSVLINGAPPQTETVMVLPGEVRQAAVIGKEAPAGLPDAPVTSHSLVMIKERIEKPEDLILPSQVLDHFIEKASALWIMDHCLCRDSKDCKDYPIDLGCLFMGEAVHGINPRLGHLATKAEARAHLERARQAGLIHMIGRNKLDTLWMGVQPGDHLLTVCNCCPCCCLFQVAPQLAPEIGRKISRMPGVTVEVNPEVCIGCGTCEESKVCFADAIHVVDGIAQISPDCRGCGRCVETCPAEAITLTVSNDAYIQETIHRIEGKVDVT
ncbi:MAG TPA: 4Fe-4S binding protein [Anaerolineaceae bacterium]